LDCGGSEACPKIRKRTGQIHYREEGLFWSAEPILQPQTKTEKPVTNKPWKN